MQSVQPKYGYGMTLSACLWLGLFPLLHGGTYSRLTHDKWVIMLTLCGVTLACFLFDRVLHPLLRKARPDPAGADGLQVSPPGAKGTRLLPLLLAAALLLWTVLSCLFSRYGADTWWLGGSARYEGLLTEFCYFALFFCFFFSRVRLKPVLFSAAAGVAVFFTVVMIQRSGGNPFGLYPENTGFATHYEFQGTIGNIDMGTGYLLLLASLFLYGLIPSCFKDRKGVAAVLLLSLLITLFLIVTMGVQFGLISLGVLFLVTLLRFLPKKVRLPLLILLLVLALLVVWFWPGQGGGLWELHEILHGRTRLSFGSDRVAVWSYSLMLARENLLFGGGSGTFRDRFNQYLSDHQLAIPAEQDGIPLPNYFDNPHNVYIAWLTDHGLPAALLFLALLFISVFRRREGCLPLLSPCSAAVLCYAVQAFFSFSVCIVAPIFWVVLGLSFTESDSV